MSNFRGSCQPSRPFFFSAIPSEVPLSFRAKRRNLLFTDRIVPVHLSAPTGFTGSEASIHSTFRLSVTNVPKLGTLASFFALFDSIVPLLGTEGSLWGPFPGGTVRAGLHVGFQRYRRVGRTLDGSPAAGGRISGRQGTAPPDGLLMKSVIT